MSDSTNKPEPTDDAGAESVDRARRRLLGMAVYVPPAVLGIISLQQAACQEATCGPSTPCNPGSGCNPDGAACGPTSCAPNGGGCSPDSCNPSA